MKTFPGFKLNGNKSDNENRFKKERPGNGSYFQATAGAASGSRCR